MLAPGQLCGPPSFHQVGEVDYFRPGKCVAVKKLEKIAYINIIYIAIKKNILSGHGYRLSRTQEGS